MAPERRRHPTRRRRDRLSPAAPLSTAACAVLYAPAGNCDADEFLFPHYARNQDSFCTAGMPSAPTPGSAGRGFTTSATALIAGENLPLVDRLLGHRRHVITAGYAHLADDHLVAAAERVGSVIAEAMAIGRSAPDG